MRRRTTSPDRVGSFVESLLRRANRGRNWRPYLIWTCWDEVVGANIARRAQPERFADGVLVVHVESHSWLQELQMMRPQIIEHLNARLGEPVVRDIAFVAGRLTPRPPEATPRPVTATVETATVELPEIKDPALAAAFARLNVARARRGRRDVS